MRKFAIVLLMVMMALTACQGPAPAATIERPIEPISIPISQKIEPTENYCVSCHTDKEQLISTAKPEEIVESESSGAG